MKRKKEVFPIVVVMITYIIILLMYLFTYSQNSYLLWGFFIVERLIAFSYDEEIDHYLSRVEVEELNSGRMLIIGLFSLLSVGIFLYTPFKYPGLFMILVIGEVIDLISKHFKKKIKFK
ncbi:MAG: hypothetical protein E7231_12360 [Cellulosilyticum sp.]|nr:hypothetical protein [Cellulosilyticum sp.]